jgi:RNA polymerase sigma-70 factor (ECF subfamily)
MGYEARIERLEAQMEAYLDGDEAAFAALHEALEPAMRRRVARFVAPTDVEDVVQAAFLRAHVARARYLQQPRTEGGVVGWYLAIARNTALDHRRRNARAAARVDRVRRDAGVVGFGTTGEGESPEELRLADEHSHERAAKVHDALADLSVRDRELLVAHKLDGMPLLEIARGLGIAAVTVRVRAHRAYRRLGVALAAA